MKDLLNISFSNKNVISVILNLFPFQKIFNFKCLIRRVVLYSIASLFLIISAVFGLSALYHYLVPFWGEALAALFLCFLFLVIALGLIVTAGILYPKKTQSSPQIIPLLEKSLDQLRNLDGEDLSELMKKVPPKAIAAVLGAVALTSCLIYCKKKKSKKE